MNHRKPIIGIVGGIGAGKSFVADRFAELGCRVIKSDDAVRAAYEREDVKRALRDWWGESIFLPDGSVDRSAIARRVFDNPAERRRLEQLLHPLVDEERRRLMNQWADDAQTVAFIWDTPLLFEVGLDRQCDVVVFVDAPLEVRRQRAAARGWDERELTRRENSQMPLDKKRALADDIVLNTADADFVRRQVRNLLSRVLTSQRSLS